MRWPWQKRAAGPGEPRKDDLTAPREDHRTYVLCGDNLWGCSITWSYEPGEVPGHVGDQTYARIHGWLPHPRPERGDVVVARMHGGAGRWVVQSVEGARGVDDMFFADLRGVIDYLDDEPEFKRATELLAPHHRSEFV